MSLPSIVTDLSHSAADGHTVVDHGHTPTRETDTFTFIAREPIQSSRDAGGETGGTADPWNSQSTTDHTIPHPSNANDEGLTDFLEDVMTGPKLLGPWTFKDQVRGKGLSYSEERTLAMPHVCGLSEKFDKDHATKEPTLAQSFRFAAELNRWAITYSENPRLRAKDRERMEARLRLEESQGDLTADKDWHSDLRNELFGKPKERDQLGSLTDDQGEVPGFFHLCHESSPSNPRD